MWMLIQGNANWKQKQSDVIGLECSMWMLIQGNANRNQKQSDVIGLECSMWMLIQGNANWNQCAFIFGCLAPRASRRYEPLYCRHGYTPFHKITPD